MEEKAYGNLPVITIIFVSINVIVWFVLEVLGDTQDSYFMIEHGACYLPLILENGEWWRLFTCLFLHFGSEHLMNNMLILYLTGMRLEHALGKIPYVVLYLGAGLCGSVLSVSMEFSAAEYAVSAGASGAVFGVIGGLAALAVWNKGRIEGLTIRGLLGMLVLSLYYGFSTSGVDNWAHIGGMLGGLVLGSIFALLQFCHNKD